MIWCPKYRRDVLPGPIQARLKQVIGEVVAEFGGLVIGVETRSDHVRLLVELLPQVAVVRRYVENQNLAAARRRKAA